MIITAAIASRVLSVVDAGLVNELGKPTPGQMCVEAAVCYALGLPHGDDLQCVSRALRSLKIRLNDASWSSDLVRAAGLRRLAVAQLGSRDILNDKEFAARVAEYAIRTSIPIALRAAASIHPDPVHVQSLRDTANRCEIEGTEGAARAAYAAARAAYAARAADAAAYAADVAARAAARAAAYAADAAAYAADVAARAAAYAARAAAYAAYAADAADAADAARADKVLSDFAEGVVQILIVMKAPGCQWLPLTEI
jgi:hypothetical protein